MRATRAFTLIEAAVALAIMAIVSTAAISAFAAFSRLAKQAEREVVLIETLRTGLGYLVSELRLAGGVGVQPWAATLVEDDCAARDGMPDCQGSDRLTLVQGIPTYPGCRVLTDSAGELVFEEVDFECCFDDTGFVRQVALLHPDVMQPVVLIGQGSGCRFKAVPIVPSESLARRLQDSPTFRTRGWENAVAILVDVKTFYVDWQRPGAAEGVLTMHVELDGKPEVTGERMTILERVADFQAAVGYEVPNASLLESSRGDDDSWWPSRPEERGRPGGELTPERAIFVGVSAIAVVDGGAGTTFHVQTPWGPLRVLEGLRPTTGADRIALPSE